MLVQHVIHVLTGEMYICQGWPKFPLFWPTLKHFRSRCIQGEVVIIKDSKRFPLRTDSLYIAAQIHCMVCTSQVLTSKCRLSPFIPSRAA